MTEGSHENMLRRAQVCRTCTRSDELFVDQSSPRKPYLSFTIGPYPLGRLIIKIWSHDQGQCDIQYEADQPYANSHTWFALGLLPKSPDCLSPPEEPYLCEIQRNVRASTETKCHTLEWRLNAPFEEDETNESEVQGWLESISSGPCVEVGVFPLARYPGWVNHVYQVKVELYDDTNMTLLQGKVLASNQAASPMVDKAHSGTESPYFLTRQRDGAQRILDQTRTNDPTTGMEWTQLAISLTERWANTCSIEALSGAIDAAQKAIKAMLGDHRNLAIGLNNLGFLLGIRYCGTKSMDDLTKAIEVGETVIKVTSDDDPDLIQYLQTLASRLRSRYEHTRVPEDLTRATDVYRKAVEVASDDHPKLASLFNKLGNCLGTVYCRTGRINDLTAAIEVFDRMVEVVPRHPKLPCYLSNLGVWLCARFEATGSMEDLERAIEVNQRAVEITPDADKADLALFLSNLGVCLGYRSERKGSTDDLDTAIELSERAVAIIPDDDANIAAIHNNFAKALLRTSDQGCVTRDSVTRAVQVAQTAVEVNGDKQLYLPLYLCTLGETLRQRYEATGSVDDLTRAIEAIQKSVEATPTGHAELPIYLGNLASSLAKRHEVFGLADDLSRGLEAAEKCVEATPRDHISFAGRLTQLGTHLRKLYERTGEMDDLTRAISLSQQAVEMSDPFGLALCLSNLGDLLSDRYDRTRLLDDLDRATQAARKAVEAARDDRHLAGYLMTLGRRMTDRYDRTRAMDDLTRAIQAAEKALEVMRHDHISRAAYFKRLGFMRGRRYVRTQAKTDQDAQLSAYVQGWSCLTSSPYDRIAAAVCAADIDEMRADWDKSYSLLREAVLLLPKLSPRSLRQSDMQNKLSPTLGLATYAATTAINAGKPVAEALSIIELGRGVIAGLLIDTRGDLSGLRGPHPSLAQRFDELRKELDSPSQDSGSTRQHWASREFDEVIEQIRAQDGFRNFLQPPSAETLMAAAESGPIIVINLCNYRCDAILVERHEVRLLELPGLKVQDIEKHVENISVSKHQPWQLLEWLWTTICQPCLDALGFTEPVGKGDSEWPHVWWVPTGLLSQLPLHAAGIYTPGSKETVLDRVVSSYAASIKALQHGRQRRVGMMHEHGQQSDAILVAMEQTQGQMSLPNARTETDKVEALCPLLNLNASTPPRRKADILEHIKRCKILHFAGHGESRRDPSQSCLLLEDWKTDPLTVDDLRESWLQEKQAFLAYLSACSTGSNQGKGLADEAIHLVSAFQLAGFRHVVGTLWEVSDPHCVDVATVLYQTLCDEGMTDEAVSLGLHRAVRKLRDDCFLEGRNRDIVLVGEDEEQTPGSSVNTFWIPYIHFGA
ncbi:uncharacterized protein FIESC28_07713 [Fusarium coffeatum]|uniref:CHAT domain-containing protein n=1 Tax=Fusarium coffeatum TaxID=231269 RepID=A0A366RBE2_9HYPO|nr:uncharacterized protein FIESC28_07713 [Fusarium coffeatum]RBR14477.1 hypothetical protein FIESC28_07713 [Fusarium coffeatum]